MPQKLKKAYYSNNNKLATLTLQRYKNYKETRYNT